MKNRKNIIKSAILCLFTIGFCLTLISFQPLSYSTVAASSDNIIYQNDFNSNPVTDNWREYKNNPATCALNPTFKDGVLEITQKSDYNPQAIYELNLDLGSDYEIEYDVAFIEYTNDGRYAGLAFRIYQGEDRWFSTVLRQNGNTNIDRRIPSNWSAVGYTKLSSTKDDGVFYRLKTRIEGFVITFWIDGVQVGQRTMTGTEVETYHTSGNIGFVVGGSKAQFDNLVVRDLSGNVLYENDFNLADINPEWQVQGTTATVDYQNGGMVLKYSSGTAAMLEYAGTLPSNNYSFEFDIAFSGYTDASRWGGVFVGYNSDKYYYQTILTAEGVTKIDRRTSYWDTLLTKAVTSKGANSSYRIKTVVHDNSITYYIDGAYIGMRKMDSGYESGKIGVTCSANITATIDNVVISKAELATSNIFIPTTSLSNPPVAVAEIKTEADYTSLTTSKPAVAIYSIDQSLNIVDATSNTITTVSEMISTHSASIIPAFYIDSEAEVAAITSFIIANNLYDALIMADSTNAELVKQVRDNCPYVRGIIRFSDDADDLADVISVAATVNTNLANVALFDSAPSEEIIRKLQVRLVSVWQNTSNDVSVYSAITRGVNGVVTQDVGNLYSIYSTFTTKSITRKPLIVGHRGAKSILPENTLDSFIKAFELGADAIELDIFLSSDGKLVVFHDSDVTALTNGTGNIEDKTLAEIQALTIDVIPGTPGQIPTLEAVYQQFENSDIVINVEIKSSKAGLITELVTLTNTYNMNGKIFVSSFIPSQIEAFKKVMPEVASLACYSSGLANTNESLITVLKTFAPMNSNIESAWGEMKNSENYSYAMAARGLSSMPFTVNADVDVISAFTNVNIDLLLTDYVQNTAGFASRLQVSDISTFTNMGFTVQAGIDVEGEPVLASIRRISGSLDITAGDNNKYTASTTGTGVFVAYYNHTVVLNGNTATYTIYSQPFTLTVVQGYIFTVTINTGTEIKVVIKYQDDTIEPSEIPVREGYTFIGFYTDEEYKNAYDPSEGVDSNLTLYAKWEAETEVKSYDWLVSAIVIGTSATALLVIFCVLRKRYKNKKEGRI